jgi:iron complex outermembrane receptor protein
LSRWRAGGRAGVYGEALEMDVLSAYEWRRFGAQGFYGTSPDWKSVERLEEWLNVASLRHTSAQGDASTATLAWRRNNDQYTLDRERPSWYQNTTLSDNLVAHADTRQKLSDHWTLALRAHAEHERINGTYRGTLANTPLGQHSRHRAEIAALPTFTLDDWDFSFGGSAGWHSLPERLVLLPALGVTRRLPGNHALFANYTEAVRQPSFLELNYDSPTSLGNNGLTHQHSRTLEAGWKHQTNFRLTTFADWTDNAVDWLHDPHSGRWLADNLRRVTTLGISARGNLEITPGTQLLAGAAWLWKHSSEYVYASRYALDYPILDTRLELRQRLGSRLHCGVSHNFWHQTRNPTRNSAQSAHLLDLSADYSLTKTTTLRLGIWNLLGDHFETYPGQPMLGRTAHMTLRQTF